MPLSGLCRPQAHIWCTDIYADKTLPMHIKQKLIKEVLNYSQQLHKFEASLECMSVSQTASENKYKQKIN